jgi:hypothetical protein
MPNNFDKAVLNKIKSVWDNTIYSNIAVTYQNVMDSTTTPNKELSLPLINIYRPEGFEPRENQTITARLQGIPIVCKEEGEEEVTYTARFIFATLQYQIDLFGTSTEMLDELAKDIVHMMSLAPTVTVTQTDRTGKYEYTETYQLNHSQGPRDVSEFDEGQRLHRYVMVYTIDTARLVNFRAITRVDGVKIDADIVKDDGTKLPIINIEKD